MSAITIEFQLGVVEETIEKTRGRQKNLKLESLWGMCEFAAVLVWVLFDAISHLDFCFWSVLCRLQMVVEFWFHKRWCFLNLGARSVLMIYPVNKSLWSCALQCFTARELLTQDLWQILHPNIYICAPVQRACQNLHHVPSKNIINFLPLDLHFTSACG